MGVMLQSVADGKVAPQIATRASRRVESAKPLPHLPGGKIPEPLARITRKAMAMEREDRYQNVKEFQVALQVFQSTAPTSASATLQPSGTAPTSRASQSTRLIILLCVVIALLIVLCVKLEVERSSGPPVPQEKR